MTLQFKKLASFGAALSLMGIAVGVASQTARAQTNGLTFTGGTAQISSGFSIGYDFRANVALTISALSYYDFGGDGLAESHNVAIYNAGAFTPLAIATVTVGSPELNSWAYSTALRDANGNPLSSLTLGPGTYTIAGYTGGLTTGGDQYIQAASSVTPTSGITYDPNNRGGISAASGGVVNPAVQNNGTFDGLNSYFGPGIIVSSVTPEPGSLALLLPFAVPAAGMIIRRRRAKS